MIRADRVLWTAGLDLQDDSSLLKLIHMLMVFIFYRLLGLKICVIMQGAGPLNTRIGRNITRLILSLIEVFVARDSGSFTLLKQIKPDINIIRGFDGLFLGEVDLSRVVEDESKYIDSLTSRNGSQLIIGFNIRLWFHFASNLIPYQFAKGRYLKRAESLIQSFMEASVSFIQLLRTRFSAKVLLISMYEPGIEPWEDDLPLLATLKDNFEEDSNVALVDKPISLLAFCKLVSLLDAVVGTRLHSALTAIRFGVPAIHISYTLKGHDMFRDLGLANYALDIEEFIAQPDRAVTLLEEIFNDRNFKDRLRMVVDNIIDNNRSVLESALPI